MGGGGGKVLNVDVESNSHVRGDRERPTTGDSLVEAAAAEGDVRERTRSRLLLCFRRPCVQICSHATGRTGTYDILIYVPMLVPQHFLITASYFFPLYEQPYAASRE